MKMAQHSMTGGLRAIADQRERALRVAGLAFLAGLLLHLGRAGHVGPLPVPLFAGLLYAGLIAPAAVATAIFLPGLTALSDAVQWSRLGFAALVAAAPGAMRPLADQPVVNATLVIMGGMALVALRRRKGQIAGMSPSALPAWNSATKV